MITAFLSFGHVHSEIFLFNSTRIVLNFDAYILCTCTRELDSNRSVCTEILFFTPC